MLKFKSTCRERRSLIARLEGLTGDSRLPTRGPGGSCGIGVYEVDRAGNLLVDENDAEPAVLVTLMAEGFIAAPSGAMEDVDDEVPLDMDFDLPLAGHTGTSLRNLLCLIYSRGPAINRATGADFAVSEALIRALRADSCTYTIANFRAAVRDFEEAHGPCLRGIAITDDAVRFTGFPAAPDVDHLTAYGQLAILMNRMALIQKRVQPRAVAAGNEKYAFRVWLVRLGMVGECFKPTREILLRNLPGPAGDRENQRRHVNGHI